ncbi:MAG: type IV conjugative transfer system protein TraL [Burkholderiaceae bacterium]|nr:type IV conjugative transfer system protein TraL [Burkholderiaceae bacterium]
MDEKRFDHLVPQRLDDSGKFLFWDTDVAMAFVVFVMLGILVSQPITCAAIGAFAAYAYNRLKSGRHPGLAAHLAYWHLGLRRPRELPPSHLRELHG